MLKAAMMISLTSSAVSVAAPAFTLPPMIAVPMGGWAEAFDVFVGAEGPGDVQGLNLYLEVSAPLEILSLRIDGAGTLFGTNSTGAFVGTYFNGGTPTPQFAFGMTTTATGTVSPNTLPVAIATILVPMGTPLGVYTLTTDLTSSLGVKSDWAGLEPAAQATAIIVPEPACALLLLAGLPLLRLRRR